MASHSVEPHRSRAVSRRHFVKAAALAGASFPFAACANQAVGQADLVVKGGTFLPMDPSLTQVDAMAIRGDRIIAIGRTQDIEALVGPNTHRIDARNLTVTPGFIDAHSHPMMANEAISVDVNFRTIGEVQDALVRQADKTPTGEWVLAHMYDDTKFDEGRPLNRDDIDQVVQSHPVMVRHRGGHTAVVNSQAFEIADITNDTPDPEGGRYFRDRGRLTGKVAEKAMDAFNGVGTWPTNDRDIARTSATLMSKRMATAGLTSTTDAYGQMSSWTGYMDALERDELYFRLSFMPGGAFPVYEHMKSQGMRSGYGSEMLRVGAVKYVADGSASERTMRMSTPYEGTNDYGISTMSQAEIDEAVDEAVASGFRIGIHANGDVTIDMVLKAYERVLANREGPNPRFRIEHCSLTNPDLLTRIKETGTIPAPFYTYAHYHGNKWVDYGEERMRNMFAHRSFLDYDIPVAPASDFTPGPFEPMMALQSMVTRKDTSGRVWGENQRISVMEALRICTLNGAFASFEEETKVVATYLGGRPTYEA